MDVAAVRARVAGLTPRRGYTFIGIGGRGGAGKSTLARSIAEAQIVGTDEFWDGRRFDLERLRQEVFDPLLDGREARFHAFDWERQEPMTGERLVHPVGIVVVEGVCALHRMFRDAYDLRIWVEAPRSVRLARGVARDGEAARSTWENHWMPMEERYIGRDDPIACADLVVDGADGPPGSD
jgi:uridine kinase